MEQRHRWGVPCHREGHPVKGCRHCRKRPAKRPTNRPTNRRGLCSRCYAVLDIREQYRGECADAYGCFFHDEPLPPFATDAQPGSEAKLLVLCERVRLRQGLWHPKDVGRKSRCL